MPGLVQEWTWEQKQGDAARFTLTYLEDGNPIDLTGWTPELAISRRRGQPPHIARWTSAPQIQITNPEAGELLVLLTPDETREWGNHPELVYEITGTPPNGETVTILEGRLVVRLEVGHGG